MIAVTCDKINKVEVEETNAFTQDLAAIITDMESVPEQDCCQIYWCAQCIKEPLLHIVQKGHSKVKWENCHLPILQDYADTLFLHSTMGFESFCSKRGE